MKVVFAFVPVKNRHGFEEPAIRYTIWASDPDFAGLQSVHDIYEMELKHIEREIRWRKRNKREPESNLRYITIEQLTQGKALLKAKAAEKTA